MRRQNEAKVWIQFARENLKMAHLALREGIYTQACFHAQQTAEKSLKALLVLHNRVPPKTHNLRYLYDALPDKPPGIDAQTLGLLDLFYAPTRYPDALPGTLPNGYPSKEIAQEAIRNAEKVLQTVQRVVEGAS